MQAGHSRKPTWLWAVGLLALTVGCGTDGSDGNEKTPQGNDGTPPSVPTGLSSTVQATSVALTWDASTDEPGGSGVAGYVVYRADSKAGEPATTTFTDDGLMPDTDYTYTVRARDRDGNESAPSTVLAVRTRPSSGPGRSSLTVESFTKILDCETLQIDYQVNGRTIEVDFVDAYSLEVTAGETEYHCILDFEISDTITNPSGFGHEAVGSANTSTDVNGVVTTSLRRLPEARPVNVITIEEGSSVQVHSALQLGTVDPLSEYTARLRIDLSLSVAPGVNAPLSSIEITSATLSL